MSEKNYNLAFPFYQQSLERPEATALWVDGAYYSYAQISEQASRIAAWLQQRCDGKLRRVAILCSRSLGAYQGILGSSWAGACYVPLNPKFPEKRLAAILQQAEPQALIVDTAALELLSPALITLLPNDCILVTNGPAVTLYGTDIDGAKQLEGASPLEEPVAVGPDAEAYLIFTSGSTGEPSGVVITTGNLNFAIETLTRRYPFHSEDRFSQFFELSFDFSVMDLFVPWRVGASTYVVPEAQKLGPGRFIAEHCLTVWSCVPSIIAMMGRMGMLKPNVLPSLRFALFSGETLLAEAAKLWQDAAPNCLIVNLYGQTEAPIGSLAQNYDASAPVTEENAGVAIGAAFDGVYVAIVDSNGQFIEGEGVGELVLSGPHVANGYLGDSQRSAAKFKSLTHPRYGERIWYHTGDLARRDANALFHYLCRSDNEIKISGHRVVLEGVERYLRQCSACAEVGVTAQQGSTGSVESLVGFVVAPQIDVAAIKQAMLAYLPRPIIPKRIFAVDELPLNANGKLDRQQLQMLASQLTVKQKRPS
ncbi:MAG: AMP-binding protein [Desulfuromonadales bacterium]|nr:AMP-binding protein [Desulfuromonadales bacterium]